MAIKAVREIARADLNDEFGVTVWQERKMCDYTLEDARALAEEILRAAALAEAIAEDDREQAQRAPVHPLLIRTAEGTVVCEPVGASLYSPWLGCGRVRGPGVLGSRGGRCGGGRRCDARFP